MKRITATALSVALAIGAAACSDKNPSAPLDETISAPPPGMVVSNVQASSVAGSSVSASSVALRSSLSVAAASSLAYVSAVPGTFPGAASVTVRNQTRGSASRSVEMIDGGFDPVGIDAAAGDVLSITGLTTGGGLTPLSVKVPPRRPPGVVRTNPTKGRTDVALNVLVVAVFSEPIDRSSVTSSSVALLQSGKAVNGRLQVSADGLRAEFIPDSPLMGRTTYALVIGAGVHDLDGDALGQNSIVTFTTASGAPPAGVAGQLLFTSWGVWQIHRIEVDGTGLTRLTSDGRNYRPAWSPDGQRIAFAKSVVVSGNYGTTDIYTMDANGANVVRLTTDANFWSAAWSPDGRKLAVSDEGVYDSDVYVISADGDGSSPVHLATDARSPAWSPDGQYIAFVHTSGDDGYDQVSVINADGTGLRQLTEIDPGGIGGLGWSPDGQRLAFSKCLFSCDLYVMNGDGSGQRRITSIGNAIGVVAWSPDGAWIAFTLSNYAGIQWVPMVAYVSVEGGTPYVVGEGYMPSWRR